MSSPPTPQSRRWRLAPPVVEGDSLARELGISRILGQLTARRGFTTPEAASRFLSPDLTLLHDPSLLPDYERARDAIFEARQKGSLIYVHGDYDVDGVTSAAIFSRFLEKVGCRVLPHVPHRIKEGYGIHLDAIRWAKEQGASLFLTCDCGVSAHEQVEAAVAAGMTVVITDHHALKETLPAAAAVMNPHREDSRYPFEDLSGAGVVFKFCAGLTRDLGKSEEGFYRAYLDLAVLGTVADVVPLRDENRVIVKEGLQRLKDSQKEGLRALLEVSDLHNTEGPLTPRSISFQLAPRINAVGRIDDASVALELLLTKDREKARHLAGSLDQLNKERREEQARMVEEAMEAVKAESLLEHRALVIAREGWHPGIIGLVAGRLAESHHRPAFVIGLGTGGVGKGSARSIPGFHLAEALKDLAPLLIGGGGHELAAGFSINAENISAFREAVQRRASLLLSEEDMAPILELEGEARLEEAGEDLGLELRRLEPYGQDNPPPLLLCRDVEIREVLPMRDPQHASLTLASGSSLAPAVIFRRGLEAASLKGQRVDVAFRPEFDVWRGRTKFRWLIEDLKPAGSLPG